MEFEEVVYWVLYVRQFADRTTILTDHLVPYRWSRLRLYLLMTSMLLSGFWVTSEAQIVFDGSLGTTKPLAGPNYRVPADAGQIYGPNLFHSFSRFDVKADESATFTGPARIINIIGRVTGGEASLIDGIVRSDISGANLFLLNSSGVLFGPNAQLHVQDSVHIECLSF